MRRPTVSASDALATGATVIGASIILGGALGRPRLTRWVLDRPSALPVAGLILLCLAVALTLRSRPLLAVAPALAAAALLATVVVARLADSEGPLASWATNPMVRDPGRTAMPPAATLVGLAGAVLAVALVIAGGIRWSQGVAVVPMTVGGLAILSLLYGDRIRAGAGAPFPGTMTAAPAAVAMVLLAAAVLAAEPTVGVTGWITADSPGRRAVRRLLPPVVAVPLVLAGLARWFDLAGHVGEARSWALVMSVVTVGICLVAAGAVGIVDRLAAAARRGEVTEVRLTSALRLARVADLARELAGAITVEEVSEVVNTSASAALNAKAASVGLIDRVAGVLRVHHGPGVSDAVRARYANPRLDARLAFTDAARLGRPVLVSDYDEYRERYPGSDASNSQLGAGGRASLPLTDRSGATFGALALSWDEPIDFDDAVTATLSTIADLVAQSLERARLIEELGRQARRNAELAQLAEALAAAATADDVMAFLAEHITQPVDAATAVVGIIDDDHHVLRRHFSSLTPEPLARHMATESLDRDVPLVDSARGGQTVILRSRAEVEARYPNTLDMFDAAGFTATAHVPLRDRTGASFGALGLGWHDPIDFDDGLLTMLSTIGDLAAQTLERASLGDERLRDGDRARLLASLAESLSAAKTTDEVVAVVRNDLAAVLRATATNLTLVVDGNAPLELQPDAPHPEHDSPAAAAIGELPHAEAIHTGSIIILANPAAFATCSAGLVDAAAASGVEAAVVIPVMAADDRPLAAVGVAWSRPITVDVGLESTLSTIGGLLGQTLERVELAEAEHHLVAGLQQQIVGPIPQLEGLEVCARYEPAAQRLGMGGDWYEGVVLGEGTQLGLVVGDVTGHGTDAAVEMLQLSRILSTLLHVGVPLDDFFALAGWSASTMSIFATAVVCTIDPGARTLTYVAAGHPPPVLIPAVGPARLLNSGRHPMIGMPASVVPSSAAQFGPGATLIAYTDGLVERRDESIDEGLERLRQACDEARSLGTEALIDHLVEVGTAGRVVEDDLAIVVVRNVAQP